MSNIYFFRGIPATGKTTITNRLSQCIGAPVFRKDDIFDPLSPFLKTRENNHASYDIMVRLIQTCLHNHVDTIVDVGLADNDDFESFLSKLNFYECRIVSFLCVCSSPDIWRKRLEQRFFNPLPNQYYRDFDQLQSLLSGKHVALRDKEVLIDSAGKLEEIVSHILSVIHRKA